MIASRVASSLRRCCRRPVFASSGARLLSSAGPTLSAGPPGAVEAAAEAQQAQQAVPYIIDVTDADFMQKVINPQHKTPILLDCHAEWCGPCKELAPLLDAVVRSYEGKLILAKMDVDQSPQVASQMQIKQIPLLAGFKHSKMQDGREGMSLVGSFDGAPNSEAELRKFIEEKLGVEPPQASPEQQVAAAFSVLEQGDAAGAVPLLNAAMAAAAEASQDEFAADAAAGILRAYMAMAMADDGDGGQAKAATAQLVQMLQGDPLKAHAARPLVSQALVRLH
jgi:putative thioredoxin|eukprot:COSAG06_NODE_175_length_21137_cov_71.560790_15_plen_280_part_00